MCRSLFASEQSRYGLARECVEWALTEENVFEFFDALTADSIKEQVADCPRFHGYEATFTEIYEQVNRDFLLQHKALEDMWDKAARQLMLEFSESELVSVREYQHRKTGKEFLSTETGKKWLQKAEPIVRSAFEEVRQTVFHGSRYEAYRKAIEQRIALYEAQGKLPAALVRADAPPLELKPSDSDGALFQIFEGIPKNADRSKFTIDSTKPLLVVHTLRDVILAQDNKGVLLRLNEKDTRAFAELTKKFEGQVLFLQCTEELMEGMRIAAPIEDGYLGFKHPQSAAVAEYLRKRFRIGEFK